jgi:hypothetical protein
MERSGLTDAAEVVAGLTERYQQLSGMTEPPPGADARSRPRGLTFL